MKIKVNNISAELISETDFVVEPYVELVVDIDVSDIFPEMGGTLVKTIRHACWVQIPVSKLWLMGSKEAQVPLTIVNPRNE
jgi:hypothetical protein